MTKTLTPKLAFMLGFINHDLHFEQVVDGNAINSTAQIILSDILPDVSELATGDVMYRYKMNTNEVKSTYCLHTNYFCRRSGVYYYSYA